MGKYLTSCSIHVLIFLYITKVYHYWVCIPDDVNPRADNSCVHEIGCKWHWDNTKHWLWWYQTPRGHLLLLWRAVTRADCSQVGNTEASEAAYGCILYVMCLEHETTLAPPLPKTELMLNMNNYIVSLAWLRCWKWQVGWHSENEKKTHALKETEQ